MLSVITPVLNGAHFIEKNIASVKLLTIPYEHIVVDGGSTDGTIEIVSKYPGICLLSQSQNSGMYGAIDQGIKQAQGDYIIWLNADDLFLDGIEKVYSEAVRSHADLAYGNAYHHFINERRLKRFYPSPLAKFFLQQGMFPFCQSSSIFSKEMYAKCGGFRYNEFRVCGDLDLYQRISFYPAAKIVYVPIFASVFLKYPGSLAERSRDLYIIEYKKLRRFKGNRLFIRIPFKLSRWYSQFFIYPKFAPHKRK